MPSDGLARKIIRMPDFSRLLARIEELRIARGIKSDNQLSLEATGTRDAIRQLERGNTPTRERLRGFSRVLGCELAELEDLAPDVRLDSKATDARTLLDLYESVPPERRKAFLDHVKAARRLIGD